ncbi:acyltransferase [Scytonema sp. UIC 10036]|uniref:acyltransferase n=1 Tax=Scytonema sp. UIC 10036 TaxID=2304196 RepID=UPI0012DAAB89|nr:acyltransferase [Scytonema sp. UIC 10036]MUG98807.1 acyltransferase [Scytonema sp. UIC 10036]
MSNNQYSSKLQRLKEVIITGLLGELPSITLGCECRNLLYRLIFSRIGSSVYIQEGVEFIGTSAIEIGNGVHILKGARLDAGRYHNNKLFLADRVAIERNVNIGCLDNTVIHIGSDTFLGPNVSIAGPGNIKIGKRCLISSLTKIYANDRELCDRIEPIKYQGISRQGITIENDCWLGHSVTVLDGVTIGEGSVVAAGAVVTKDIPPNSVAVGVPAQVIKCRTTKQLLQQGRTRG